MRGVACAATSHASTLRITVDHPPFISDSSVWPAWPEGSTAGAMTSRCKSTSTVQCALAGGLMVGGRRALAEPCWRMLGRYDEYRHAHVEAVRVLHQAPLELSVEKEWPHKDVLQVRLERMMAWIGVCSHDRQGHAPQRPGPPTTRLHPPPVACTSQLRDELHRQGFAIFCVSAEEHRQLQRLIDAQAQFFAAPDAFKENHGIRRGGDVGYKRTCGKEAWAWQGAGGCAAQGHEGSGCALQVERRELRQGRTEELPLRMLLRGCGRRSTSGSAPTNGTML